MHEPRQRLEKRKEQKKFAPDLSSHLPCLFFPIPDIQQLEQLLFIHSLTETNVYMLNFYYALDFMNKPCPPVAYNLVEESEGEIQITLNTIVPRVPVCCNLLFCVC